MVYGGGDIVFCAQKVKPEDAVDAVCSGLVVYGGGDIVFDTKRSKWIQWEQYAEDTVRSGRRTLWTQYAVDAVE